MITTDYNPSPFEVELLKILKEKLDGSDWEFSGGQPKEVISNTEIDNPHIILKTVDSDGQEHHFTIQVIQKPDSSL